MTDLRRLALAAERAVDKAGDKIGACDSDGAAWQYSIVVVRAMLLELRDPSEEMIETLAGAMGEVTRDQLKSGWRAVIDKILEAQGVENAPPEIFYTVDGQEFCEHRAALAEMLQDPNMLFIGGCAGPLWETKPDREPAGIYINCNDLFIWGCADAQALPIDRIGDAYKAWRGGDRGLTKFACMLRGVRPQGPVIAQLREEGRWDADLEALPES